MKYDSVVITNWLRKDRLFHIPNWAISKDGAEVQTRSEQDVLTIMSVGGWRLVSSNNLLRNGDLYTWLYFEKPAD